MTPGLDAMEEGYVNAIKTLIDIYYTTDDEYIGEHISSTYVAELEATLKELRPPVEEEDPLFTDHKKFHHITDFSRPACKFCKPKQCTAEYHSKDGKDSLPYSSHTLTCMREFGHSGLHHYYGMSPIGEDNSKHCDCPRCKEKNDG